MQTIQPKTTKAIDGAMDDSFACIPSNQEPHRRNNPISNPKLDMFEPPSPPWVTGPRPCVQHIVTTWRWVIGKSWMFFGVLCTPSWIVCIIDEASSTI